MATFGNYSRYYNLLYKDKDYNGEVGFIHKLIQKYSPDAQNILDLGCGTGRHDALLAEKGYAMTGVDMSEEMLLIASSQQLNRSTAQPLNRSIFFMVIFALSGWTKNLRPLFPSFML